MPVIHVFPLKFYLALIFVLLICLVQSGDDDMFIKSNSGLLIPIALQNAIKLNLFSDTSFLAANDG